MKIQTRLTLVSGFRPHRKSHVTSWHLLAETATHYSFCSPIKIFDTSAHVFNIPWESLQWRYRYYTKLDKHFHSILLTLVGLYMLVGSKLPILPRLPLGVFFIWKFLGWFSDGVSMPKGLLSRNLACLFYISKYISYLKYLYNFVGVLPNICLVCGLLPLLFDELGVYGEPCNNRWRRRVGFFNLCISNRTFK